ncbi:MAG TPA: glycosyltransferase family 4 protein [Anaerolineae bacterium]|nr:glycosyltransferase family 4 protein [Anaerolineae bacterium]HQH39920.1 glycosyltransferase family 4 protein [Anaerolineae bacterium]
MRVLIVLTYYRPHTSGLTIYAERLAKGLARRGHEVTILTSHYSRDLARREAIDGVQVVRAPVLFRLSKGVIMPTFGFLAWKLVTRADVISLHLPQFDAAGVALRGRWLKKPTVLTYHCDLQLPPGIFNRCVNGVINGMNDLAGKFSHKIVAYTQDFADHSPYLQKFGAKLHVIPPPVELPPMTPSGIAAFAKMHNPQHAHPVIGMAARLASEKGVEVLLHAFPRLLERYPHARILFAGQYRNVLAEETYARKLEPIIRHYEDLDQWKFLDVLDPVQMAAFYPNLDLLVVPSLNSTESFGLVQVEAMLCGVPCVASDLPGVRQPIQQTGMGEIAPIGDADGLAQAMLQVLDHPGAYIRPREEIAARFSTERTAADYEALFEQLLSTLG